MKNIEEKREIIINEIKKGEYRKEVLADILKISMPTLRRFLRENPDIAQMQEDARPNIKEKGNAEYNKKYHQQYERKDNEKRAAYFAEYNKRRRKEKEAE